MTFVPFPDTVSLTHRFLWNDKPVSYTIHMRRPGYTPTNAQGLANFAGTSWHDTLRTLQSNDLQADLITVQDLTEAGAPNYENITEIGQVGAVAIDSVPNNTALLVSHRTADTGRSARGRTYLPGLPEDDAENGVPTSGARAAFAVQWGIFIADLALQSWIFVVAQRYADGVPLVEGVTRPVTAEIFPFYLGTQRLRQAT